MKRDLATGPRLSVAVESHTVTEKVVGASHSCSLPEHLLGRDARRESPGGERGASFLTRKWVRGRVLRGSHSPGREAAGQEKVVGQSRV